MTAAMPHIEERCRSSPRAPTSVPIRKLLGEEARREMEDSIVAAPDAAPVIRGTGGCDGPVPVVGARGHSCRLLSGLAPTPSIC